MYVFGEGVKGDGEGRRGKGNLGVLVNGNGNGINWIGLDYVCDLVNEWAVGKGCRRAFRLK